MNQTKISRRNEGRFFVRIRHVKMWGLGSVNFDASAWNVVAREVGLFGLYESNFAINRGMDSEIATHKGAWAGDFCRASLTDEDFASLDGLAAKALDAKALAGVIMVVFAGTASFDMGHTIFSLTLLFCVRQPDFCDDK